MAFTDTWDAAFEAAPADSEDINLGANRIRHLKVAVRERMQVDHVWEDAQEDGKHNKLTLVPQSGAPPAASPNAFLYTQTIGSFTELLYEDSGGNVIQLTETGYLYPFALRDFSIASDLAVGGFGTFGEDVSFGTVHVSDFAVFTNPTTADTTLQFGANTYFTFNRALNKVQLVVGGALQEQWPP